MTRRGEAVINGLVRGARRDELLLQICAAGQRAVHAGLLAYALPRRKANGEPWNAPGWAKRASIEIFGAEPRPQDRRVAPQPLPNFLIEEWVAGRKKPRRIKAAKPAPLLDGLREKPLPVDANGFVEGTLMMPKDFEVKR